jgi:hypothetical protein
MNVKNNMVIDGKFTKLIYSDNYLILNGLYLDMDISIDENDTSVLSNSISQENNHRWKPDTSSYKHNLYFNKNENLKMISDFYSLEKQILERFLKYNHEKKEPVYTLHNQLRNGCIKYYREHMIPITNQHKKGYFLKISGIWETTNEIGITFKIIEYITETV